MALPVKRCSRSGKSPLTTRSGSIIADDACRRESVPVTIMPRWTGLDGLDLYEPNRSSGPAFPSKVAR
jgi:hypothetical protein